MFRLSGLGNRGLGSVLGVLGLGVFFACRPNETEDDTNGIRFTYLL